MAGGKVGAPNGNLNAEQWTFELANELFQKALAMSVEDEYDFIGEIARDLGVYRELFSYLTDKFQGLQKIHKTILCNLEANCFSHAKKGMIKEATAIVNLKSNYNWTDRQQLDHSNKDGSLKPRPDLSKLTEDELRTIADLQRKSGISP